jgi:broad specificity phosphatase PhoE
MLRSLALIASLVVLVPSVHAEDAKAVAAALKQGGYVIVFRHGETTVGKGAADPMGAGRGKSTSTERQLSPRGRQAARAIGDAFKTLHIPIGSVYASQLDRAVETGRLISGKEVTTTADLTEAGDHVTLPEKERRADGARQAHQHPGRQPQAEHRRCLREGLGRRAGGRSDDLPARRQRQVRAGRSGAG